MALAHFMHSLTGARASSSRAVEHVMDGLGVAAGAFAPSYLAAKSRMNNAKAGKPGGGELMGVPYTLLAAVGLGAAGLAGLGGRNNSAHLMNAAKGSLAAYAATQAVKLAYKGSTMQPTVGALPPGTAPWALSGKPWALSGKPWALSGNQYAQYGATPETEGLFREAGL